MKERSRSSFAIALPYFAGLLGVLIINWFVFQYAFHQNYLIWYITNGTLIGIIVGFVASVWEGLESRTELLSAHPGWYIHGCIGLMAAFFASISAVSARDPDYIKRQKDKEDVNARLKFDIVTATFRYKEWERDEDLKAKFDFFIDTFISLALIIAMAILAFAWLIVVAPLNYFITIFTGAVARMQLTGQYQRAIVIQSDGRLSVDAIPRKDELPEHAVDVSIAAKPFAITQAITALVLFIAKELLVA